MKFPTLSVVVALVSCGLSVAVLHHLRSREEGKYWWLREQNDRMRYQAYQRHQAATAAARAKETSPAAEGRPAEPVSAAVTSIRTTDTNTALQYGYHDAGLRSPAASLQTFVWACDRSDERTVAAMIAMEDSERRKAEQFLAGLPAAERAKLGSLEQVAAKLLILSSLANSFPSSEVLAAAPVEQQGEERAVCGSVQRLSFMKVGADWKYELRADKFEGLYREVSQALEASGNGTVGTAPRT